MNIKITTQMVSNRQKKKRLFVSAFVMTLFMALFTQGAMAQTVNMTNGTYEVGTGGVNFYDSGGAGSGGTTRYRHNEEYTYTFTLPALQSESGLKVEFSMLRVNDDHLYIYEGTAMNDANLIADFTCNDWYYSFTDLCASGAITVYSHGPITFKFISNEQYRDNGWAATINIIDPSDIPTNPPAPVIAMRACENVVELIPTMKPTEDEGTLQLFYTINGGSATAYSEPFSVNNNDAIEAYAKLGENQSATNHNVTVNRAAIAAPTIAREDENNNNLIKITRPSVPSGANDTYKVRYTLDGSDPTTSSTAITINWIHVTGVADRNDTIIDISAATWVSPSNNFQVKAVTQGTTCPDLMSAQTTYTTTKIFTCTPVITLTGTGETGGIDITCATTGATIYYTVDGSTPTPGADGTYVWRATGSPTTIAAGGTVRAIAKASNHEDSHMAWETYVPGGTSGGSGVYSGIVLLDDREPHTWTYYSDSESPIHSLKPADVKITYTGFGENTMTSTSNANMPGNSDFNANVASDQVAVNVGEAGNQFIYLKTLENANNEGTGNYPYTMIPNPFQVRPTYTGSRGETTPLATQNLSQNSGMRGNRDGEPILISPSGSVTTNSDTFYDSGGANGSYSNNEDYTKTIYPSTAGYMIQAVFSSFATESSYDYLYIYDGTSTSATLIGSYSGSTSPGTVTATNSYGALTFRFTSDYSSTSSGWAATITAIDPSSYVCEPTWTGYRDYYISNFAVSSNGSSLLNSSSTGTARTTTTEYYDSRTITANPGDVLTCVTTMNGSGTYGFAMWVDFDGDGLDAGDLIYATNSYTNTPYTGTLTIPDNTPEGEYRMRILGDYNVSAPSNPCGSYQNGEAEDYKLIVANDGIDRYNVTIASGITGGSVSANPTRAPQGTTITLTATPNTGYDLSSITVTGNTSGSTVTVSGSGTTRTFTMPAEDVTVTATFYNPSDAYRGFYAWRVKSMSEGLSIKVGTTTYTSANIEAGIILYPDQEIEFITANAEGNEVEFEALWAKAYVTTSTNAMSSGNYAYNSGVYKNAYERNFHVVSSLPSHSTYPYIITTLTPTGGNSVGTITRTSNYSAPTDVKFENMYLHMSSYYINAAGHNLTIGRGVKYNDNNSTNVASAVYGYKVTGNSSTFSLTESRLRIESGRYTNVFGFQADNGATISSAYSAYMTFGSDYDRAKGTNNNNKLVVTGAAEVGQYIYVTNTNAKVKVLALSGIYGSSNSSDEGTEFYLGYEMGRNGNKVAYRSLEMLGGEYLGGVSGGTDNGVTSSTLIVDMRIKGGIIHQYLYGSGQFSSSAGGRRIVITGGTFDGWISGACYGTEEGGGITDGDISLYFGGKANQTSTEGLFGGGYGTYGTNDDYYTVNKSYVVAADEAQIAGSVYGGGNNGYCTNGSEVYVKGDKLNIAGSVYGGANLSRTVGDVSVTVKGGTIAGSVYGGAWGNTATSDIVYVTGSATVNVAGGTMSNVYGAGYGARTVVRSGTNVTVSGGTINNNVYGGGEQGSVGKYQNNTGNNANAVVTVSGGEVKGNVYGAGKGTASETVPFTSANIYGTTTVTLEKEARVKGSVYGGGENGSVGYYNNNSTATGSTVNVNGGIIDKDVFGGGSYGVTNGNVVVNITWANDEYTKTEVKGSVYGGAYGKRNKVYVKGTRTVNMNNGLVGQSIYGGSRNADDALTWTGTDDETATCNVVNISGGEVEYQVFAAGFFGHTYGSVYAFIGQNAINNAPEHAPTTGFNYAINSLRIRSSVWAGADFGNFDGTNFGDPTVEGKSYVYIDGTNYNTVTDNPQNSTYMNVEGSVYGCGTSCDAGKTDTKVVVRNYGQPVASGSKNIDEPYQTATRSLYSIQRANYIILDNAHINYVGQGKVNSLVTTEKYAIHNASEALRVVNGSSVMINYPIDEIKMLLNGTCTDVYAASPTYSPVELSNISVENKYRVYNGTYINVFYTTETENGNEEKYGELSGFAYMMTDAYQGEDDTKSCAYARPKWGQGASFEINDPNYDNRADGGFISYTATYNEFDATGYNADSGVQMRYENHVRTTGTKVGEDYFRIWRYGGLYSYREAVLIAKSSGDEGTYNICDATIELPATEHGGYYRIQAVEGNGGTTINYGTDASTCNVGFYGDTYSTSTSQWMTYTGNAFVPAQAMTATNVQNGLHIIDGYPNVNFGLVAIPQGAMESTTNDNWLICESSDAALAAADTKWTYSNESAMPEVLFRLTYSNEISVNKTLDPITIYFEQYNAAGELVDVVQVALIITTKTSIEQNVKTRVVAIMNGTGETGDVYSGRVTLPSYSVNLTQNEDPSTWTLQSVRWSDEVEEDVHTGAELVGNQQANYEGSDSKFAMMFYASTNKDNTYGWDEWQFGPYDASSVASGVTVGKTYARKDFTINFDLYYDGEMTSTTKKLGTMTFVFAFNHYGNGDENRTITIAIDVFRKGTGENYYLDGVNGDNAYPGTRPDAAKKTLAAILTRTEYSAGDNIFIVNTVTQDVAATLSWDGFEYDHITIYRYPGGHPMAKEDPDAFPLYYTDYSSDNPCFKGVMVDVKTKMEMHYVEMDGFAEEIAKVQAATTQQPYTPVGGAIASSFIEAFGATAPMFEVEKDGQLTLANNVLLTHNANTSTTNHGGAVKVDEGGTLNMIIDSKIQGNAAAGKGGGVYMDGTMNISGLVNVTGNTVFTNSKAEAQESNVYLNKFAPGVVTMAGDVDEESRLGITKDEWNNKWFTPVVYSDVASRLDVFYSDYDLGRVTDDKEMYELNKLPTLTEFNNPTKYLFFVGTWVTAVTEKPEGYADDNIDSPNDLAWAISVATGYNKVNDGNGYPATNFKLTADIDMDDNIWVPIGNSNVKYTGTFDGNGHVVTGIRSPLDATDKGMFGVIDGATIENVIAATEFKEGNAQNLAALVAVMEDGTISNCEAAGEITGNNNTQNLGGLVAKVDAGTIHSVFAVSTLTGGTETVMGGLIGTNANNGNLFNSYSNVEMSGSETMAGLVGNNSGRVENCYVIGTLTPAFAAANTGQINYCYAEEGITNYAPGTGTLSKHGNYAPVQSDIKALDYMYGDNKVTASGNGYVKTTHEYVNNHTVLWDGLLSVLNQWVADGQIQGKPSGLATWNRPVTTTINGDLPILAFSKDNCLGNLVDEDGKMLRYSAYDPEDLDNNNGLDNLLGVVYKNKAANIYLYNSASNVVNGTESNKLFIHEDAALVQDEAGNGKAMKTIDATVGVTFDNSPFKEGATDSYGVALMYDWHMMSTPLKEAPMGITYFDQSQHNYWSSSEHDKGQAKKVENSYLPNMERTSVTDDWSVMWDFYTYYEPQYHWINFKRNSLSHFHYDEPHENIAYTNEEYLIPGRGYLAAINQDTYLNNTGTLNNGDVTINLTGDAPEDTSEGFFKYHKGSNLIGNPYQAYLDLAEMSKSVDQGGTGYTKFYIYEAEQNSYVPFVAGSSKNPVTAKSIHPHQGFFVLSNTPKDTPEPFTFSLSMATAEKDPNSYFRSNSIDYPVVNLFVDDDAGHRDLTIIELNRPELGGAVKTGALHNGFFKIAAHVEGNDYGLVFTPEGTERVPVHFKTREDGTYTMTWETHNGEFTSLFLVDNLTGVRTDMLRRDHYTFNGSVDDYAARFYITYNVTDVNELNGNEEVFAYYDGNDWIVTGKGQLQVVDVTGRVLKTAFVNGDQTRLHLDGVAAGVYIMRLTDGQKSVSQKIVVK